MEKIDKKLIDIYEVLGDYLEKAGYFDEKEENEAEVSEEVSTEEPENEDENDNKTYTDEEVTEILNRE